MTTGNINPSFLEKDIALLAALQHRSTPNGLKVPTIDVLQRCIPRQLFPLLRPDEWMNACIAQLNAVEHLDPTQAKRVFLEIVMKLFPLYGSTFFKLEVRRKTGCYIYIKV